MFQLVHLFILDSKHALSAIELAPQDFVSLYKAIQLCCQILILNLKHMGMSFQSFFFLREVVKLPLILVMKGALTFHVLLRNKQSFFLLFQSHFSVTKLERAVSIALLLKVYVPTKILILLANALVVSLECRVLSSDLCVVILDTG